MRITTVLFYKEHHTDTRHEIHFYPTVEIAETVAAAMIESFKFWGGGSVPIEIVQTKWTKRGSKTLYHNSFDSSEWEPYARENGNLYGYYEYTHQRTA